MIVADVNLVAYLLISGEHTDQAIAVLRKDSEWAFPYLWRSELRNILAMYIQHRGMSMNDATLLWDNAAPLARHHEYEVDPESVLKWVSRRSLTAYDAEYVALAEHLKVPLVTYDQKLQVAASGTAFSAQKFLGF